MVSNFVRVHLLRTKTERDVRTRPSLARIPRATATVHELLHSSCWEIFEAPAAPLVERGRFGKHARVLRTILRVYMAKLSDLTIIVRNPISRMGNNLATPMRFCLLYLST